MILVKTQTFDDDLNTGANDCLQAAMDLLEQGVELLEQISDEAYTRRLSVAGDASIGGHYRHCLDHFDCLLSSLAGGYVDFDQRRRDPDLECKREKAVEASRWLGEKLGELSSESLMKTIRVRCKVHYREDRAQEVDSTIAREIMYCVAHGVHHFALIAIMARVIDIPLPSEFGVAPSTLQHRARVAALA